MQKFELISLNEMKFIKSAIHFPEINNTNLITNFNYLNTSLGLKTNKKTNNLSELLTNKKLQNLESSASKENFFKVLLIFYLFIFLIFL